MAKKNVKKEKQGYVSAKLKRVGDIDENAILKKLVSLQGIGKASVVRKLLRDYGPKEITELEKKVKKNLETNHV